MVMQTPTAIRNTVQKLKDYGVAVGLDLENNPEAFRSMADRLSNDYLGQLEKAVAADVVRPGRDYSGENENLNVAGNIARRMRNSARFMRKATGADYIETFNRVMDYSFGEGLAEINLALRNSGDPKAQEFWNRYGAGIDDTMPHDEIIKRAAANFVTSIQSSYGPEGLPAWMLNNSKRGLVMKIQRYGWENMRRVQRTVLEPAVKGNYTPLLIYLLGSAATAPLIIALNEKLTGRPSGLPTEKEMEAAGANKWVEKTLNIMQMAEAASAFGTAGSAAATLAGNIRGQKRALVGDPIVNFSISTMDNMLQAVDAARAGEPAVDIIQEALKRTLVDTSQNLRPLDTDRETAKDVRDKQVFDYLMGTPTSAAEIGKGLMVGRMFDASRKIQPTMDKAREGDREAYKRLTPEQRRRADNYPGGYEDPKLERKRREFTRASEGEESLQGYLKRRDEYRKTVRGKQ
jgi:hypothetical protein